ncbi:hypothetical protein FRX31_005218 [Thalictrum thalictroides]|uniref:RING-type E3 ubiquitin transferase n=1 Tax=Thalictrum thalictroides TaxID=46969 RepID=A0A7J6X8K4_THATH|nr:hypothetical protein FRX31_005218 [Thalictrum thalictroides]
MNVNIESTHPLQSTALVVVEPLSLAVPMEGIVMHERKAEINKERNLHLHDTDQTFGDKNAIVSRIKTSMCNTKANYSGRLKQNAQKDVDAKRVAQLLASQEAREEVYTYEAVKDSNGTIQIQRPHNGPFILSSKGIYLLITHDEDYARSLKYASVILLVVGVFLLTKDAIGHIILSVGFLGVSVSLITKDVRYIIERRRQSAMLQMERLKGSHIGKDSFMPGLASLKDGLMPRLDGENDEYSPNHCMMASKVKFDSMPLWMSFKGLQLEHLHADTVRLIAAAAGVVLIVLPVDIIPRTAEGFHARVNVKGAKATGSGIPVQYTSLGHRRNNCTFPVNDDPAVQPSQQHETELSVGSTDGRYGSQQLILWPHEHGQLPVTERVVDQGSVMMQQQGVWAENMGLHEIGTRCQQVQ